MGLARAGATEVQGFQSDIQPLLRQYCFDCHGDGAEEGGMRLDVAESAESLLTDRRLWGRV